MGLAAWTQAPADSESWTGLAQRVLLWPLSEVMENDNCTQAAGIHLTAEQSQQI